MLCPACFHEKNAARQCPSCEFDEPASRDPRFLPYRHTLGQGRYVIGEVLGVPGGFGVAYKALDTRQGALVVVKECLLTESNQVSREAGSVQVHVNPGFQDEYRRWLGRFREEAGHISRFSSPYIVRVTEVFEENNTAYYVMPFVEGDSLDQHCQAGNRPLPEQEVQQLALQLLSALAEMHAKGVIHRDIKPSNILITRHRSKPVLIDFGAARDHFDDELSRSHMAVYSPRFAPIEQVRAMQNQGPWTDLYSLCATLHYCLLGEPPPRATDRYHPDGSRTDPFVPIHERLPDISPGLATVINNGLAVLPQKRLKDAGVATRLLHDKTVAEPEKPVAAPAPMPMPEPAPLPATPAPTPQMPMPAPAPAPIPSVGSDKTIVQTLLATPLPASNPRTDLLALVPAALMLLYGFLIEPSFTAYLNAWPGMVIVANCAGWILWKVNQRPATPAPHPSGHAAPPVSVERPVALPATPALGIQVHLLSAGLDPIVQTLRPGQTLVVGRSSKTADLSIPNELLSGRHVSISVRPDGAFELRDLDSLNHTHERRAEGGSDDWRRIQSATGTQGRFMLGPPQDGGVLLELRQTPLVA